MNVFADAEEALSLGAPLARLYRVGLARVPDPQGLRDGLRRLRAGSPVAVLADEIAASAEFAARHGPDAPPDAFFIRTLFRNGLDREPDAPGLATFLARVAAGATRADILLAVAESQEARLRLRIADALFPDGLPPESDLAYQLWLAEQPRLGKPELAEIGRHIRRLQTGSALAGLLRAGVLFSLLLEVQPVRPDLLLQTLESIRSQLWTQWEVCLLCRPGLPPAIRMAVERATARISGLHIISVNSESGAAELGNAGLNAAAGAFAGFLDAGDTLPPTSLYELAAELARQPDAILLYADEDEMDGSGRRRAARFKSDWSPDLVLMGDAAGQPALYRTERLRAIGGLQANAAPFHRHDLLLRATEGVSPGLIRHVPAVLYHRGRARLDRPAPFPETSAAQPSVRAMVMRHLAHVSAGMRLYAEPRAGGVWPSLAVDLPDPAPLVSAIVPTRDRAELLESCMAGLLERTDYPAIEVLVADNGSEEPQTLHLLRRLSRDPRVRVLDMPGPFAWSALNNAAAREANGEVLLLLNNDIEVVEPGWLRELVANAMRPDVGAVGARLLYAGPDLRLQHGGIVLGKGAAAVHVLRNAPPEQAGYMGRIALTRDVAAVTGACLAIRQEVFKAVGGLEETRLRVTWGDIDLCLRVRSRGLRVVWTPLATLVHLEQATRGHDVTPLQIARHEGEQAYVRHRWGALAETDPFLNPNLRATEHAVVLAEPPQRVPPWAIEDEAEAPMDIHTAGPHHG